MSPSFRSYFSETVSAIFYIFSDFFRSLIVYILYECIKITDIPKKYGNIGCWGIIGMADVSFRSNRFDLKDTAHRSTVHLAPSMLCALCDDSLHLLPVFFHMANEFKLRPGTVEVMSRAMNLEVFIAVQMVR